MGEHLTDQKKFKSDKYEWCPEDFFALKFTDPVAQEAILLYAEKTADRELAGDLVEAVKTARDDKNE